MLSLFSFLVALGIVVDDAIVIGENIYAHIQMGKSLIEAAIDGTIEVMPSVTASVTTTIIAFTPMFFVSGVMGKFMAVIPFAVIAMLVISLWESMFVLPCHLSHKHSGFFQVRFDPGLSAPSAWHRTQLAQPSSGTRTRVVSVKISTCPHSASRLRIRLLPIAVAIAMFW